MKHWRWIFGFLYVLILGGLFAVRHELLGWVAGWLSATLACTIIAAVYMEKSQP